MRRLFLTRHVLLPVDELACLLLYSYFLKDRIPLVAVLPAASCTNGVVFGVMRSIRDINTQMYHHFWLYLRLIFYP